MAGFPARRGGGYEEANETFKKLIFDRRLKHPTKEKICDRCFTTAVENLKESPMWFDLWFKFGIIVAA